jgi:hypothetical protein
MLRQNTVYAFKPVPEGIGCSFIVGRQGIIGLKVFRLSVMPNIYFGPGHLHWRKFYGLLNRAGTETILFGGPKNICKDYPC